MELNKLDPTTLTKKQVKTVVEVNNCLRLFDLATMYYNTSDLSWKKCIKKAKETAVFNPMARDL
jgi:hypothetical protein